MEKPLHNEKRFELQVSKPGLVILVSEPGGGKSHLQRHITSENRKDISHGIVFSPSAFRPVNFEYIPPYTNTEEERKKYRSFKHLHYNNDKLQALLNYQESFPEAERPLAAVWVDDDLCDAKKMFSSPAMISACTGFRQWNLLVIISTQYSNFIPPIVRNCATQVGLFWMDTARAIEACFESYGVEFPSYEEFKAFLMKATQPVKSHKFLWKDKADGGKFTLYLAPAHIAPFRLDFGPDALKEPLDDGKKNKKRKRGPSEKEKEKKRRRGNPFLGALGQHKDALGALPQPEEVQEELRNKGISFGRQQ